MDKKFRLLDLVCLTNYSSVPLLVQFNIILKCYLQKLTGTWQATDEAELENALEEALKAGYRHIDTAYLYTNEVVIGRVLERWLSSGKLTRDELFIVTKVCYYHYKILLLFFLQTGNHETCRLTMYKKSCCFYI